MGLSAESIVDICRHVDYQLVYTLKSLPKANRPAFLEKFTPKQLLDISSRDGNELRCLLDALPKDSKGKLLGKFSELSNQVGGEAELEKQERVINRSAFFGTRREEQAGGGGAAAGLTPAASK